MALIGGISHDVRTFATRLRLRVETIPDGVTRQKAIEDLDDMIRLLDDALMAVRNEATGGPSELIDFTRLAAEEVDELRRQGLPVTISDRSTQQTLEVLGEPLALRRVLQNLLGNAVRYGGRGVLHIDTVGDTLHATIADDGPGIPAELRDTLTEPFTRLETSRNRATGGSGLGLAIARALIEAHGGTLSLDPGANQGATVGLSIPLFSPRD